METERARGSHVTRARAPEPVSVSSVRHPGLDPFWRAAVRLDRGPDQAGAAEEAAAVLCGLARAGATSLLASVLRVELRSAAARWTVACYEIGDAAPSALHEHDDPGGAVAALVGCGTPSHIASELICNGDEGLQWVAMARARSRVCFQLPDELNTSARHLTEVSRAMRGWRDELERNAARVERPPRPGAPQVRAPRAGELFEPDPGQPRPARPERELVDPVLEPGAAGGGRSWRDGLDDDGFSSSALAVLGLGRDEPTPQPAETTPSPSPTTAITDRMLNSAVRTALASAVPYLEQYLLDAVAERVAPLAAGASDELAGQLDQVGARVEAAVREQLGLVLEQNRGLLDELRRARHEHLDEVRRLQAQLRRVEARLGRGGACS